MRGLEPHLTVTTQRDCEWESSIHFNRKFSCINFGCKRVRVLFLRLLATSDLHAEYQ